MECRRKLLKVDMESSESEPGSDDADDSQDVKVCDSNRRKKDVMSSATPQQTD